MTTADLIKQALFKINVLAAGEPLDADAQQFCLTELNEMLDTWNSQGLLTYNVGFSSYTLTPNHQPHTIGPGFSITNSVLTSNVATFTATTNFNVGDKVSILGCANAAYNISNQAISGVTATTFSVNIVHANIVSAAETTGRVALNTNGVPDFVVSTNRPVEIKFASIILNNITPNVNSPLALRDDHWWANQRVQTLTSSLPTDLYYSPDFPKGSLNLWPVPTTAWGIQLEMRFVLGQLAISSTIQVPPGYLEAISCSLAEKLCGTGLGPPQVPGQLQSQAMRARAAIRSLNSNPPSISLVDSGMPKSGYRRSDWNYRSGRVGRS